jgi:hypothetical protein
MNTKLIRLCLTLCMSFTCISLSANAYNTGEEIGEDLVDAPLRAAGGLVGIVSGAAQETGRRTENFFVRNDDPRYNTTPTRPVYTPQQETSQRPRILRPIFNK